MPPIIEYAKANRERGVTQLMYVSGTDSVGTPDDVNVVANRKVPWGKITVLGVAVLAASWLLRIRGRRSSRGRSR